MKKEYIQPTFEVVEIKAKLTLLAGSGGSLDLINSELVDEKDEL